MKYNKLVSVVMPVHNGERFLREAIEGVLNQSYTNFEFLIIENCSTDSSFEIITSYKDSRIRVIIEDDCGIVQAYNRGFKEAEGEYIVVQDHDDVSFSNRIESLLRYSLQNSLDFCGSSFEIMDKNGNFIKDVFPPNNKEKIFEQIFFNFFSIFNPTLLIKKEVLIKNNYFDINCPVGADCDFIYKSLVNFNYGNNNDILIKYRYHKNSTSRSNNNGEKITKIIGLKYFTRYKSLYKEPDLTLAKIHYFYGQYFSSFKSSIRSIKKNKFSYEKLKYLLLTSVFAFPLYIIRKRGFYYNKSINKILKFVRKNRFSTSN